MQQRAYYIFAAIVVIAIAGLAMVDPVAQNPAYHDYADKRVIFGIPYFWNVASNLPMFFIGLYGIWQALRHWSRRPAGAPRWIPMVLSLGIFTTFFGSSYYHWVPENGTLMWDRLPMTLMFMSLFGLLMYDYLGQKIGSIAFFCAVPLGMASVLYWHFTEAAGHGDLRPYAFVQFFPMIAAVVLMLLFPGKVPYVRAILFVLAWYTLAKVAEHNDTGVYEATGFWSGHTVKHLLGAVGLVYVMQLVDGWFPSFSPKKHFTPPQT